MGSFFVFPGSSQTPSRLVKGHAHRDIPPWWMVLVTRLQGHCYHVSCTTPRGCSAISLFVSAWMVSMDEPPDVLKAMAISTIVGVAVLLLAYGLGGC